jgi:hypothetical protein
MVGFSDRGATYEATGIHHARWRDGGVAARGASAAATDIDDWVCQQPVARCPSGVVAAFRQGLSETGFVEGHNLAIAFRWAEGRYD